MSETLPGIVLRLAREQLAAESGAEGGPLVMFPQAPAADEIGPADREELPATESVDNAVDSARASSSDPPLLRGGAIEGGLGVGVAYDVNNRANATAPDGALAASAPIRFEPDWPAAALSSDDNARWFSSLAGKPPHAPLLPATSENTSLLSILTGELPHPSLMPTAEHSAVLLSGFADEQRDPPSPPLLRGGDEARDVQPIVASISEHGRRMEDMFGELEQSLAAMFATQAETVSRLRDRVLEHDRRWLEQSANRRAAFAPS
jgi:hypothetical protein